MFSLLRSNNNNKHQTSASHFAVCKVQYLDDAPAAGGPAREVEALEPARLSITKPREQPRKYGGGTTTAPAVLRAELSASPTAKLSSAPLPGSKLLKAWRAARK